MIDRIFIGGFYMYNILALFIGAIISIMLSFNGTLESNVGSTYSVVIIHAVGLITILIVAAAKKEKFIRRVWYETKA